ncbi:MAG: glutamine--fructose-6-phosphate transaminase (isomerizing) [Thermoplasmata archaeon]|nr:MAG: glutamine--fructose-6-phosphate transaminase (isomerizing) [Thermoplasmata archaeon]
MCGIIGYVGFRNAREILLEGLKRLDYRGYDSAGVGLISDKLIVYKEVGEIKKLEEQVPAINTTAGIGHTRWATHGGVTKANAHPHTDCKKKIAVVHNGIIENFKELRDELISRGHKFTSDTDTEVVAHLVEEAYDGCLEKAVSSAIKRLKGSYALAFVSKDEPDKIVAARKESPLVIGVGDNEYFVASDIPAFLKYTNRVIYIEDGEKCVLSRKGVKIFDENDKEIEKDINIVDWSIEEAEKAGFPHYMLKEIYEQPRSIADSFRGRIYEKEPHVILNVDVEVPESITIVACGTSFYAGLAGKYMFEEIADIPTKTELSSEYRYLGRKDEAGLVIAISQSGETADTLAAVRGAKKYGCKVMAITNVVGSSLTRIADYTILTRCGPEIGVAATKTFTAQLLMLLMLALDMGLKKGTIEDARVEEYISHIKKLPSYIQYVLNRNEEIKRIAEEIKDKETVFFIGRGINYPLALEGALKLKEISYIHAEGFAAGELKHGPFALLTEETPVVAVVSRDKTYEKMLANIREVKARNSPVVAIADEEDMDVKSYVDEVIRYPATLPIISCIPIAVVLQLLAYHAANLRGCPIDKPRNLAKSVTVE